MSSVVISGDTSGSITLQAPAVAGSNTLTLPASTGTIITTASSGQSIPKAALPTGSILQVVSATYATNVNISTTTLTSTGVSASITPTSSTSKIMVFINNPMRRGNNSGGAGYGGMVVAVYRNSTNVYTAMTNLGYTYPVTNLSQSWTVSLMYLDSPATTSSTSYTMYFANNASDGTNMSSCVDGNTASITLMEIAA